MKKRKQTFFSVSLSVALSLLVFSGVAYAASIDAASELGGQDGDFFDFGNSTITAGSLRVGSQGSGGVTFFNGSIVNDTTTYGHDNPVTIADNLRVDGGIQRGHNFPSDNWGVKILDSATVYGGLIVNEHASFGQDVTIAGSFNSSDADAKYASKGDGYTKSEADAKFASKGDGYTKSEADAKFATQAATDIALLAKANSADVYAKSVLYTQTQIDNFLASKAETSDVYTQAQINGFLADKANVTDVYTQAQIDTAFQAFVPEAQAQYSIINGSDFLPEDPTHTYCRDGITGTLVNRDNSSNQIYMHTLNIPDGSVLNNVEIQYVDDHLTEDVTMNIWTNPSVAGFPKSVTSTGEDSNTIGTMNISSISHVIDNAANQYILLLSLPTESTGNLGCTGAGIINGVTIQYTTPTYP